MVIGAHLRVVGRLPFFLVTAQSVRIEHVFGVGAEAHAFVFENNLVVVGGDLDLIGALIPLVGEHPDDSAFGRSGAGLVADDVVQGGEPEVAVVVFDDAGHRRK